LQDGGNGQKSYALHTKFNDEEISLVLGEAYPFKLSWSHYQILMRVDDSAARSFYEIEAANGQWDYRFLQRQVGSSLYERLALSRNKSEVMRLAKEGQTIEKPRDILKGPLVLEFLGLEEKPEYSESDLENAIITKLHDFLLELGNVGRSRVSTATIQAVRGRASFTTKQQ
jgi:predicted nuclease of restriction endonuclease-like (RecB) superfamily